MKTIIGILLFIILVVFGLFVLLFSDAPARTIYTQIRSNLARYWRSE